MELCGAVVWHARTFVTSESKQWVTSCGCSSRTMAALRGQ